MRAYAIKLTKFLIEQITEDVQLDYAEITSVPPLPLWTLLVADKESPHHPSTIQEAKVSFRRP